MAVDKSYTAEARYQIKKDLMDNKIPERVFVNLSLGLGVLADYAGLQATCEVRYPYCRPCLSRWGARRAGETGSLLPQLACARSGEWLQVHRLSLHLHWRVWLSHRGRGEDRCRGGKGVFIRIHLRALRYGGQGGRSVAL